MRGLDPGAAALVRVSAALARRNERELKNAMRVAAAEAAAGEVEEALLQSYLFLGYPVALNALALWRSVSGEAGPTEAEAGRTDFAARGREVCRIVYGGQYGRLRDHVRRLHPEMEHWMVEEGYGKVLGRPGLSLTVRELCIVAILAVLGTPRQLYSHLRGALHAGASPAQVEDTLSLAFSDRAVPVERQAREVWSRVRARIQADPRG